MRFLLTALLGLRLAAPAAAQLTPPNDAGMTMGHIHLNVRDVEAQKKFWIGQFGAAALERNRPGVKLPGMLVLFERRESAGGTEGTALDHVGLKVQSLPQALEKCRAAGIPVLREFKGSEGFPNAYVMGPDEVKIELQEDAGLAEPAVSHHLHYYVSNPPEIRDWYANTLGMRSGKRGIHLAADIPGMNLSFQPFKPPPTIGTKGRSVDHVGFEVKNLKAVCERLAAGGVKFDAPYRVDKKLGFSHAFLTDPLGVSIELTEGLDRF